MEDTTTVEQRIKIQKHLTDKYEQKESLFEETDPVVNKYVAELWQRIIDSKRLDIVSVKKKARMIDKLASHTSNPKAVIVLDAGIATEQNLQLIEAKGYKYLCVSRSGLKEYKAVQQIPY
jgi:predicted HAD superfamily phosphohydrolase